MEIARAGWVLRLSSVLRRWKRAWLVLYQNGHLAYFESPDKHQPEEVMILPGRLAALHRGGNIPNGPAAPEGRAVDSLVQLVAADGEEILLISADNGDDAAAWHIALDQARVAQATAPPAYAARQQQQAPRPIYPQAGGGQYYPQAAGGQYYPQAGGQYYQPPPPGYAYQGGPQVTYVQQPPTTVIIERDPYYYGGYPYGGYYGYDPLFGVGVGAMTGLAMGSMMMGGYGGCWW